MKISFTTSMLAGALALTWSAAHAQTGSPGGTGVPGGAGSSEAPGSMTPNPETTTPSPMPPDTTGTGTTGTDIPGTGGTSGQRTPGAAGSSGTGTGTGPDSGDKGRLMDSPGGTSLADPDTDTDADVDVDVNVQTPPTAETDVQVYTPPAATTTPYQDPNRLPPMNRAVEPVPTPFDHPDRYQRTGWRKVGGALMLGGGFEDFTNSNLQSMTGAGGSWNVRAVAGTYSIIGVEAAYIGSARSINALGLDSNAALVSNGAEGALRLNVPLLQGYSLVEPFGFVGLGWSRYNVVNTNTQSAAVAERDDVMTLPYGGGLAFAYRAFMADARFTYRYTYRNDLMRTAGGRLNNWGVGAQIGYSF